MKIKNIQITKLCAGQEEKLWDNIDKLCKSIRNINDEEPECLGTDEDKCITEYIQQNYGYLTDREEKYSILARRFKLVVDAHFSTCEIGNLYGYSSGLFEFNFSRADGPPIVIYSRNIFEQIKVYIRVRF